MICIHTEVVTSDLVSSTRSLLLSITVVTIFSVTFWIYWGISCGVCGNEVEVLGDGFTEAGLSAGAVSPRTVEVGFSLSPVVVETEAEDGGVLPVTEVRIAFL